MKHLLTAALILCSFATSALPNLTAVYEPQTRSVKLKWQVSGLNLSGIVLQRSDDNIRWQDIYTEKTDNNSNEPGKFTDRHPNPHNNYYRLKMISSVNGRELSTSILVVIGESNQSWVMYPVPVKDVLNVAYTGSDPISGVISIFIQNSKGQVLIRQRISSLARNIQIPVGNLGRGIYDIRILISNKQVWNQRFVK